MISFASRGRPWWERMLLAAELGTAHESTGDGRGARRSARDWIVDLALFAYAVLAAGATATNGRLQVGHTMLLVDVVLAVPACLSLWVRRRYPVGVGWLAVGLSAVSVSAVHACVVAVFSAAIHARPRQAAAIAAGAIAATAVDCAIYTGSHGHAAFNSSFFM